MCGSLFRFIGNRMNGLDQQSRRLSFIDCESIPLAYFISLSGKLVNTISPVALVAAIEESSIIMPSNASSDQQFAANQVFVRNLPYDVTEEDLTKLFEEVGPLKNVSIAKDSKGSSRGFGFVKFALEEDAKAALAKLQEHQIKDRRIKLELGLKKENDPKKRKTNEPDTKVAVKQQAKPVKAHGSAAITPLQTGKEAEVDKAIGSAQVNTEADAESGVARGRQVLVFGVPVDVNKKIFSRVVDKIARKVKVEFVTEGHPISESALITYPAGKIILLTANSRPEAQKIVEALNKDTIGNLGFGKFNFSEDVPAKPSDKEEEINEDDAVTEMFKTKNMLKQRLIARLHSEIAPLTHRKKRCRLIIRNLSFQARDIHIMDRMKRFGPIVDIDLPITVMDKPVKRRANKISNEATKDEDSTLKKVETHRGFAFITFLCENDAKNAVVQSNLEGKVLKICNREVAVDHCYSKDTYLKYGNNPPPETEEATSDAAAVTDHQKDVEDIEGDDTASSDSASDKDDEENEVSDDDYLEEDNGSDLDMSEDEENEEEKVDKDEYVSNVKNQRLIGGDVNEGRTLFLRNLAYDMTADDIKAVLQRYGRIDLALVVKDKATGNSKGTAFVKFADSLSADRCLKECEVSGVEIKHKTVKVTRAIDRDSAEKIKQGQKPGKDKRNMYLANEGLSLDGNATAKMNEFDREKRTRAQADKKKKLQNPLFFVSHERLSIRNLAKNVKDHDLKILCLKATKAGLMKDLITIQDMQNLQLAQGPELFDPEASSAASSSSPASSSSNVKLRSINNYSLQDLRSLPEFDSKSCIRSAKVILDLDRAVKSPAATKSASAPSRGYGFVEFSHHAYALACLRELNNNPAYENMAQQMAGKDGSKDARTRLICEFSLENIRKVKILKDRQQRADTRREEQRALSGASEEEKKARKKEKRRVQREHKRQRSESNSNASSSDKVDATTPNNKKRKRDEEEDTPVQGKMKKDAETVNANDKKKKRVTIVAN